MATEPKRIKIELKFERTEGISEHYPTEAETYYITTDEAESMVERCSTHEIIDSLGKLDYNNAKQRLRNTEPYSASAKDDDEDISVIDVVISHEGEDPAESWLTSTMVREALRQLDVKDRLVLVGVQVHGYSQTQVAKAMGVSQPEVAKWLKKARRPSVTSSFVVLVIRSVPSGGPLIWHHLNLNLAAREKVVGLRRVTLRECIARLILGESKKLTLVVPGDSVDQVTITQRSDEVGDLLALADAVGVARRGDAT